MFQTVKNRIVNLAKTLMALISFNNVTRLVGILIIAILVATYPAIDWFRGIVGKGVDCKRRFYALNQTISTKTLTSFSVKPKTSIIEVGVFAPQSAT